jgi:gluconokinase
MCRDRHYFRRLGASKTTIGKLLADELGWQFYEADDFHSQANIEKMRRGIPLTDKDRWPWLGRLREQIKKRVEARQDAVLACSALKRTNRQYVQVSGEVKFVFLRGDYAPIAKQMRHRHGHFMNPALLRSQFADLEEPKPDEDALTIELGRTPEQLSKKLKGNCIWPTRIRSSFRF